MPGWLLVVVCSSQSSSNERSYGGSSRFSIRPKETLGRSNLSTLEWQIYIADNRRYLSKCRQFEYKCLLVHSARYQALVEFGPDRYQMIPSDSQCDRLVSDHLSRIIWPIDPATRLQPESNSSSAVDSISQIDHRVLFDCHPPQHSNVHPFDASNPRVFARTLAASS